ncbi:MAG: helix-turn-helix transcriptional regulator [Defluviimonas sp.]|uniref:ArsR/SmtB family transcription factor n=1 Tax=Albidovulum sp. TaxID=1872424 RepID=UPI001DFA65FB|nr:helix-turn-helix transcriptional regulator [Paracoccaceae bacterium]MCC0063585.1 helix-turn-helix transcriptional regulator [Defluviimonas sp.]
MAESPDIAQPAALIGDPARAAMLLALMRGQALTACELAHEAGVALSTTSSHLSRLRAGGLVAVRKSGRHKYFALAGEGAAGVIEALIGFAGAGPGERLRTGPKGLPGPRDPALREARVCYNHLAGERGVRLYDSICARGFVITGPGGPDLSPAGRAFARDFGVAPEALDVTRQPACRECLDWSMRRSHLGGRAGRGFLAAIEARGWACRVAGSRVIRFTPEGARRFDQSFPVPRGDESLDLARTRT